MLKKCNIFIVSNISITIKINFAVPFPIIIFALGLANNQADKFDY